MGAKIIFNESADSVSIYKKGWSCAFEIDNEPKFVEIIKGSSWYVNKGYLYSTRLRKALHRVVMEYYCGEESTSKMIKNGWVIDHLNNSERYNCRLENLCIIPRKYNVAKGQTVDNEIERMRIKAGIGLYCLGVNSFQLAVGFNERVYLCTNEDTKNLATIWFNFNSFRLCYFATGMMLAWLSGDIPFFNIGCLCATEIRYREKYNFSLFDDEEERGGRFIERAGKWYMNINNLCFGDMRLIHKPAKFVNM